MERIKTEKLPKAVIQEQRAEIKAALLREQEFLAREQNLLKNYVAQG